MIVYQFLHEGPMPYTEGDLSLTAQYRNTAEAQFILQWTGQNPIVLNPFPPAIMLWPLEKLTLALRSFQVMTTPPSEQARTIRYGGASPPELAWLALIETHFNLSLTPTEIERLGAAFISRPLTRADTLYEQLCYFNSGPDTAQWARSFWNFGAEHKTKQWAATPEMLTHWTRNELLTFLEKNLRGPLRIQEEIQTKTPYCGEIYGTRVTADVFWADKPLLTREPTPSGFGVTVSFEKTSFVSHNVETVSQNVMSGIDIASTYDVRVLLVKRAPRETCLYRLVVRNRPKSFMATFLDKPPADLSVITSRPPNRLLNEKSLKEIVSRAMALWDSGLSTVAPGDRERGVEAVLQFVHDLEAEANAVWNLSEMTGLMNAFFKAGPAVGRFSTRHNSQEKELFFEKTQSASPILTFSWWPIKHKRFGFPADPTLASKYPAIVFANNGCLPTPTNLAKILGCSPPAKRPSAENRSR